MTATDIATKNAISLLTAGLAEALRPIIRQELEYLERERVAQTPILSEYPDIMTRKEVAAALRVSVRHVITLTQQGKLGECKVVGNKALYQKPAIVKFLKSR